MRLSDHPQFKPGLILLAVALIGVELLWISQRFDALGLTLHGDVSGWRAWFGQLGQFAKLCVAIAFTTGLVLHTRFTPLWQSLLEQLRWQRFVAILPWQLACFAALTWLTRTIFGNPETAANLPAFYFGFWLLACALTLITWLFLFARIVWLRHFVQQQKWFLIVGIGVGTGAWGLALFTRELWGPMSEFTFTLAVQLLSLFNPSQLVVSPEQKTLGLGDFVVSIAPACSGYEGVGLVTAFTGIYVWLHRHQLRFPRMLLLFPLGAMVIWLLNVVRICVLIVIGHYWSPEVAVGGFHSQAGWLTFIITSLAILWLAGNSALFAKPTQSITTQPSSPPPSSTAASQGFSMILPLAVLLASTLVTSSLSAGFDWLYPLRVVAVGAVILVVWPSLQLRPYRIKPIAVIAGLATAVIWTALLGNDPSYNASFGQTLTSAPTWQSSAWIGLRLLGAAITVPIAEELAFRGYLLCQLSNVTPSTRGHIPFVIVGIAVSSLTFGALHGAWLAGTVAGLIYALVRLRSDTIADTIVAHSITNTTLFAYAAYVGAWHLL